MTTPMSLRNLTAEQRLAPAVIEALWIGETEPDFFSWLIQKVLSYKTDKEIDFSHNAFRHMIEPDYVWHCTLSENKKYSGVCREPWDSAMKGSVVRARKLITLNVSNEAFAFWLKGEEGKEYSQSLNAAAVIPLIKHLVGEKGHARNCSRFLALALQYSDEYKFPKDNRWTLPTDTFKIIKPNIEKPVASIATKTKEKK